MGLVDIIIPTYKPDESFRELVRNLENQSVKAEKILITNTEQKYYDRMTFATSFNNEFKNIEVKHIFKSEFDHGRTRNEAVKRSKSEYFLMMTQDAKPLDDKLIEKLLEAFKKDSKIVAAYARQVASPTSSEAEKYTRNFNYPNVSAVHSLEDVETLGIKAYYLSDVCAMYRRDKFDELGGFLNHTIFNEDMLYAAKAINAGYKIAYVADACVEHSHEYTLKKQYRRYFDNGVSHAKHPEVFEGLNTNDEGMKLVKKTISHLKGNGRTLEIVPLLFQSTAKYLGFRKGKHYKHMSKKRILECTLNPEYWKEDELIRERTAIDSRQGYGRSEEELKMLTEKIPSFAEKNE